MNELLSSTISLFDYCKSHKWAGYDPYDALNSKLFFLFPFLNNRIPRIVFTQVLKRIPVNIRPLLLIPKTQNPKALGLFISAIINLSKIGLVDHSIHTQDIVANLSKLRGKNEKEWCWGYSFPWQTKKYLVPRWSPNLVCTTFIANGLIDLYDHTGDEEYLRIAKSAASYVRSLSWTNGKGVFGFSYPLRRIKTVIHNANFLASALLCRIDRAYDTSLYTDIALNAARYSASRQRHDGSWYYGELSSQDWVDNFHTGYNLCALKAISEYLGTDEFYPVLQKGFSYYLNNFFDSDNVPKYFDTHIYPIDGHCVAQSILTLVDFKSYDTGNIKKAYSVFKWALTNLSNSNGYFYYQINPNYRSRISYMRWTQAWMLLALTTLLEHMFTEAR